MNQAATLDGPNVTTLIHSDALPWDTSKSTQKRFRALTFQVLGGGLVALLLINEVIPYPVKDRSLSEKLPARMARVILEEKEKAIVIPQVIELNSDEANEVIAEVVPESEPEILEVVPSTVPEATSVVQPERVISEASATAQATEVEISQAREVAATKGVLALSNQLSTLTTLAPKANSKRTIRTASSQAASGSAGGSFDTVATATSSGIQTTEVSAPEKVELSSRDTSVVAKNDELMNTAKAKQNDLRTSEELQLIFDQNKAAFYSLYKRALRKTLGLQGRIVFNLTVLADGSVKDCQIKSSELDDPDLESKLVARIKTMNFGPKDVAEWNFDYHIDFAPGG